MIDEMNEPELEKKDIALGDAEIASIIEASKKASLSKRVRRPQLETPLILLQENL